MSNQIEITASKLNKVAEFIGTNDKSIVISVVIKSLVSEGGMTVEQAVNTVFGEGSYQTLANEVYQGLANAA